MGRKERWEDRYFKLRSRIAPGLKYSQTIYEELLGEQIKDGMVWLDAGCGHEILPEWRFEQEQNLVNKAKVVIGVDADFEGVKQHRSLTRVACANLESLPFAAESFDLITCNMVVEHLANPRAVFAEFYRVLQPGGKVIVHTPNAFGYVTVAARLLPRSAKVRLASLLEERAEQDVFPALYRANTFRRLDALLSAAGFEQHRFRHLASSCQLYFSRLLVICELIYVRLTLTPFLRGLRTNLLCVYEKHHGTQSY